MAHSNRNQRRELRKSQKVAKKAAWASLVGSSKNKKLKGISKKSKSVRPARIRLNVLTKINGVMTVAPRLVHGGERCGNVGCKRCSSLYAIKEIKPQTFATAKTVKPQLVSA